MSRFPMAAPLLLPIDHRLEISTQVGPTKLSAAEPVVSLPAVRSDHLPTSGAEQLLATFPHRVAAIWKIVTSGVTTTQSQVRRRASRQEVSSTFAGCVRTYPSNSAIGLSRATEVDCSNLATIPVEMDRPKRSWASCRIGRLPSR